MALLAAGLHQPQRGRWFKRRGVSPPERGVKNEARWITPETDNLSQMVCSSGDSVRVSIHNLVERARAGDPASFPALRSILLCCPETVIEGTLSILNKRTSGIYRSQSISSADGLLYQAKTIRLSLDVGSTRIESLLLDRITFAWLDEAKVASLIIDMMMGGDIKPDKIEYLDKLRSRSTNRLIKAAKSFATVRRYASQILSNHRQKHPMRMITTAIAHDAPPSGDLCALGPSVGQIVSRLIESVESGNENGLRELQRLGPSHGVNYLDGWLERKILGHLQTRASQNNLLLRTSVTEQVRTLASGLSDPTDGPIERLLVNRSALLAVEVEIADLEAQRAYRSPTGEEVRAAYDRRRDRASNRLLRVLKALASIRKMGPPTLNINQLHQTQVNL